MTELGMLLAPHEVQQTTQTKHTTNHTQRTSSSNEQTKQTQTNEPSNLTNETTERTQTNQQLDGGCGTPSVHPDVMLRLHSVFLEFDDGFFERGPPGLQETRGNSSNREKQKDRKIDLCGH
jgi:hypothetical protein